MREPLEPSDPEVVGRFRLTARIGRGGMGTVYLGEAPDEPPVAIKLINPQYAAVPEFRARFRREIAAARRVRSHSTAPVVEASLDEDPMYVAVEFIDGPDLESAVAERGPLRGSSLEQLAVGIATALRAIHEAGLVHRDLKPSNVLLSPTGPRVIDFGISRARDELTRITASGQVVGTPAYVAPELIDGRPLTPAADVFSWGGVIAFAGTGRMPFDGRSVYEVLNKVGSGPPDLDGLDPLVRDVVERALSKVPERRPTVAELLSEFSVGISETKRLPETPPPGPAPASATTPPPTTPPPTPPPAPWTTHPPVARPRPYGSRAIRLLTMLIAGLLPVALVAWGLSHSPAMFKDIQRTLDERREKPAKAGSPTVKASVGTFFIGTWRGRITESGGKRYVGVLKIRKGRTGEKVGTSRYAALDCSGDLRLLSATSTRLRLRESITRGRGRCVSGSFTLTRKSGALDYSWDGPAGSPAKGRLTRQN
ncbi:serine/threonine-protein kinase [Actinomadura sp. SCN-SB]|uniref:serine/threonine-protein kinase n=1 Tax=Actinomadura sp. SCN-SB TaxID=3373092 RepID=UPI00375034A0